MQRLKFWILAAYANIYEDDMKKLQKNCVEIIGGESLKN